MIELEYDVMTFTGQFHKLQAQLAHSKHLYREIKGSVDGELWLNWASVEPSKLNNNSVSIVRVHDLDLINALGFEILAQGEPDTDLYAIVAADPELQAKLESAVGLTPIEIFDDEGVSTGTYTEPKVTDLGVIAKPPSVL